MDDDDVPRCSVLVLKFVLLYKRYVHQGTLVLCMRKQRKKSSFHKSLRAFPLIVRRMSMLRFFTLFVYIYVLLIQNLNRMIILSLTFHPYAYSRKVYCA